METTRVEGLEKVFTPYVLEIATSGSEEDGSSLCLALVVIRKPSGVLLAVPAGFFPEEILEEGQGAGPIQLIGPSHYVVVPGGRLEEMDGSPPAAGTESLDVLLVDMGTGVLEQLVPVADYSGPTEILHLFAEGDPFVYPLKDQLIAEAWDWILSPDAESRVQYYSAGEEAEEVPVAEAGEAPVSTGQVQPGLAMPSAKPKAKVAPNLRQRKPTTAALATSLEAVVAALPTLTSQIAQLNSRTKAMEEQMAQPGRLSALRQPIGSSAMGGSGAALVKSPAELFKEMPPPPTSRTMKPAVPGATQEELEVLEMHGEKGEDIPQSEVARAMLAQSTAITALAAQLANMNGDPMQELASSSSGFSSRGATGRMKLQQELASHRGTFFAAVMLNMSRRMNPSAASNATPQQLAAQGVTMTKYVERFGGYGRARDYRPGDVADCTHHGLPSNRELAGSQRCHGSFGSVHGTDLSRWGDGCGSVAVTGGGPPFIGLHKPFSCPPVTGQEFCSACRSTMDYSGPLFHQGAGCHQSETCGPCGGKGNYNNRGANPKGQAKASAEGLEEEEERPGGWPRRGCIAGVPKTEPKRIACSHHLTPPHGEGTCPGDRCYPEPGEVPGGESRKSGYKASRQDWKKKPGKRTLLGKAGKKAVVEDEVCPQSITFQSLAASIPRWVLATKTRFAYFVSRSFHTKCQGAALSTAVFPLPLADFNLFGGRGLKLSKRRWRCLARKRLLHLIIVALNFLHDGMTIRSLEMLGRRPNATQQAVHRRLGSLIAACDSPGSFAINPGRSGNELIARLKWLEDFAKTCPLVAFGSYGGGPEDLDDSGPEKYENGAAHSSATLEYGEGDLAPYRPLNASRLKLTGYGGWDLAKHLHDDLWLPFVEPAILRHGHEDENVEGPDFRLEDRDENLKLAKLWSAQGLLCLSESPPYGDNYSRVFNNLKNEKADRQIGDRRLMNAAELPARGPSKQLPGGYLMTSLHCPPGYSLRGIVTDRKDFYHQAGVTRSRAKTNCLPFAYDVREFEGTVALQEMREAIAGHGKSRDIIGDCYGGSKRRPLLVEPAVAYPCFSSLFQ